MSYRNSHLFETLKIYLLSFYYQTVLSKLYKLKQLKVHLLLILTVRLAKNPELGKQGISVNDWLVVYPTTYGSKNSLNVAVWEEMWHTSAHITKDHEGLWPVGFDGVGPVCPFPSVKQLAAVWREICCKKNYRKEKRMERYKQKQRVVVNTKRIHRGKNQSIFPDVADDTGKRMEYWCC